jgi:xanthine dehydrogenase YagS FAD-binding subunit
MSPFTYVSPGDVPTAVDELVSHDMGKCIAGGTNLLDLMKENVERPSHLVDINRLPLTEMRALPDGGFRIGALVTNADAAYHPEIERRYPLLAKAILAGASPLLRNMATTGGNLMQRTRCMYFYDTATPCNKRTPGSGCAAVTGCNKNHAILGTSEHCIATHPSDMCVALAALGAVVNVAGPNGERQIPFSEFHRLPEDTPHLDTTLKWDEIITAVDLPSQGFAQNHTYLKVRERTSYAFALVSVAVGLEISADTIREARLALGGVAHKPWRDEIAEAQLRGQAASRESFRQAAETILRDAKGSGHNNYKIELAKRAIVRALIQAAHGSGYQFFQQVQCGPSRPGGGRAS